MDQATDIYPASRDAIVVIAAGAGQLPVIKAVQAAGYAAIAVDRNCDAPGLTVADYAITESTYDTGAVLSALQDIDGNFKLKGVLARTSARAALLTASAICEEFSLPGLTPALIDIATIKTSLADFCQTQRIATPKSLPVGSFGAGSENSVFPDHLSGNFIVKPDVTDAGKAQIRLCHDMQEYHDALVDARAVSPNGAAVMQEFIDGQDITCLCLADHGRAHIMATWDELVGITDAGHIVGLGVALPALTAPDKTAAQTTIADITAQIVAKFPESRGLMLLSYRVTPDNRAFLIEIHIDLGGDQIADLLLPASAPEFDYFDLAVKVATGTPINLADRSSAPDWQLAAILYRDDGPPDVLVDDHELADLPKHIARSAKDRGFNLAHVPQSSLQIKHREMA